jgi:hypothetical protein
MALSIETAVSEFGRAAKSKLSNPAAIGQPEDQLRAPFEKLLQDAASLCNFAPGAVVAVGETSQRELKTRPDYSVTVNKALVGFVELKAPGKGANPPRFKDPHDKAQWERLSSLPNLIYSDGSSYLGNARQIREPPAFAKPWCIWIIAPFPSPPVLMC